MVKSFLAKKQSKRVTCRRKHKIERKIREHKRKVRKENKQKQKSGHRRKLEIQVPNKCPFKDEILREAQEKQKLEDETKVKRKEELKQKRKEAKENCLSEKRKNLGSLVNNAEQRQNLFEIKKAQDADMATSSSDLSKGVDNSVKTYYSEVKKVIDRADVVIEVLDARDPLGSRSRDLESTIVTSGKRLVLLLNKIDLIPKDNVVAWLKYLRNEFPTVAFKASTQAQNTNLGRAGHAILSNTSKCIGADLLMKLLGNYCRNKDIKTSIVVGIVGYPNVGKSSVINSLKRKSACQTGALPGITKNLQQVQLDKQIRLIDSPGVALCSKDAYDRVEMALKNVVRIDLLQDPVSPVEAILRKCTKDSLIMQYKICEFQDVDEFLSQIARKVGRLKKGGIPDKRMAAKRVLHDWNGGKIRYYTVPPETAEIGVQLVSAELLTTMSKEFDLESLEYDQKLVVEELKDIPAPDAIVLPAWKDVLRIDSANQEQSKMDIDRGTTSQVPSTNLRSILKKVRKDDDDDSENRLEGNKKLNKSLKLRFKKAKKKRKRADKLATSLSDVFEHAMEIGQINDKSAPDGSYNFEDYFT